jgi:hypothetical protein
MDEGEERQSVEAKGDFKFVQSVTKEIPPGAVDKI